MRKLSVIIAIAFLMCSCTVIDGRFGGGTRGDLQEFAKNYYNNAIYIPVNELSSLPDSIILKKGFSETLFTTDGSDVVVEYSGQDSIWHVKPLDTGGNYSFETIIRMLPEGLSLDDGKNEYILHNWSATFNGKALYSEREKGLSSEMSISSPIVFYWQLISSGYSNYMDLEDEGQIEISVFNGNKVLEMMTLKL